MKDVAPIGAGDQLVSNTLVGKLAKTAIDALLMTRSLSE